MNTTRFCLAVASLLSATATVRAETIDISIGHQSMCTDTYTAGIVVKELKLIDKHLPRDGKYAGVRVGVTNGGCAGMSYTMDYASEAKPFEEVMEDKGVKIFIDPKAILFLIGTELDFVQEKLGARFVFNNPNQTSACGCGESVQITPAQA